MKPCVLALGFFDGVHLGHGGLLRRAAELGAQMGLCSCAVTFDRSPTAMVTGESVGLLTTVSQRKALMQELYGIEVLRVLPFDEAMRNLSWEDFARQVIVEDCGAKHVICGHDFRFGKGGKGTPEELRRFCQTEGLGFDCIPEIRLEGQTVSSSHIRTLLSEGKTELANAFLGHPHMLQGIVVNGRKIGRTMGIPTANLSLPEEILLPRNGVYAGRASFEGQSYPAVINIGTRPTFEGKNISIEPWLLDFSGDLYGKELQLELYAYLREERQFADLPALHQEVCRNSEEARRICLAQQEKNLK